MIKTVFLDMDGCISDFQKGVYDAFDQPYNYAELPKNYDFWVTWPGKTVNREQVNAICDTNFWTNLPWTHDGLKIFEAVRSKFNPEQIYLLTVPMPNIESPTGKWMWVRNNIPGYLKRTIITQAPKSLFAKPGTLLIDDHDFTVDGFIEAGGRGLLMPRPWNRAHAHANRTVEVVEKFLRDLC